MAEIPSDIASSAAQSGTQARDLSKVRDARQAGQAHTAERQSRAVDEADTTVDTDDADAQIFADAEGAGSQGRAFEQESPGEEDQNDTADEGITRDQDGQLHVDLEA